MLPWNFIAYVLGAWAVFRVRIVRKAAYIMLLILVPAIPSALLVEATAHLLFQGRLSLAPITARPSVMQADPVLGWIPKPNVNTRTNQIDFGATVRTNNKGLFDNEHPYAKPEGGCRILILGDSFLAGGYVELEELLGSRLESNLPGTCRVEVINLGVTSYSTVQQLLYLKQEGLKYEPDIVLLAFFAQNDVRNNSRSLEARAWPEGHAMAVGRPYLELENRGAPATLAPDLQTVQANIQDNQAEENSLHWKLNPVYRSMTWQVIKQLWARRSQDPELARSGTQLEAGAFTTQFQPDSFPGGWSQEDYKREWEQAWALTETAIRDIHKLTKVSGAEFGLLLLPSKIEMDPSIQNNIAQALPEAHFDFQQPEKRMRAIADASGFLVLDLEQAFASGSEKHVLFNRLFDQHWTAEGHEVAGEALSKWMLDSGLLARAKCPCPQPSPSLPKN